MANKSPDLSTFLKRSRRFLLIEEGSQQWRAAVLRHTGQNWQCEVDVTLEGEETERNLSALLDLFPKNTRLPEWVVVASSKVAMATVSTTVAEGLSHEEATAILRWESESILPTEGGEEANSQLAWQVSKGRDQTHLLIAPQAVITAWRAMLDEAGLKIAGFTLPAAVHWSCFITQHSSPSVLLWPGADFIQALFLRGSDLELASYAALDKGEAVRGLVRDLRGVPDPGLYMVKNAETQKAYAALVEAGERRAMIELTEPWPNLATTFAQNPAALPWLDLRPKPPVIWRRPNLWWAAAAAAALALVFYYAWGWRTEIKANQEKLDARIRESQSYQAKITELKLQEEQLAEIQDKLKLLENEIATTQRSGLSQAQLRMAQPAFVRDLLTALGSGFARRGRVEEFFSDCTGQVSIKGRAAVDAMVQSALASFHKDMERYPELKALNLETEPVENNISGKEDDFSSPDASNLSLRFSAGKLSETSEVFNLSNPNP